MLRNISPWVAVALLLGCTSESSTKKTDSAAAKPVTSTASAAPNRYAELAGDTLQLVSVGGHALPPQSGGGGVACDAAHIPLSQHIVLSADSSYWGRDIFAPGCLDKLIAAADTFEWRGSYRVAGDTLESRGRYRVEGDTLDMHASIWDEANQFSGLIFPDSVVQVDTSREKIRRYARKQGLSSDPTLMGRITVDTVLLARDLDASGKTDYVARISRLGPWRFGRETTLAIYLDAEPGSRPPDWVRPVDVLEEEEPILSHALTIAPGISLIDILWSGADATGDDVVIVEHGKVRKELAHDIDYGNGVFEITQKGGQTVLEATLSNLELRGKPVTANLECRESRLPATRLTFDVKTDGFKPGAPFCVKTNP